LRTGLLAALALTNFYLLGVMVVLQRVVYPSFGDVSREAFPTYYAAFTSRIPLPVVLPEFLALLSVVPLFWVRPQALPAWAVWATLGAGLVYMGITFGLHLPVHRSLGSGDNSAGIISALVRTNGARTLVQACKCALICWMLTRRGD
jgi:hypothetical protein